MTKVLSVEVKETILKIARFAVPQLLTAVFSLYALSIVSKNFGGEALLGYGLGQSYGTLVALFMSWGWPTIGASLVAPAEENKRYTYLWSFFKMLVAVGGLLVPIFTFIVWFSAPTHDKIVTLVSFFAAVTTAFMPTWWFIASNLPFYILYYDVIPRAISTFISIVIMKSGGEPFFFPLCNMLACFLGIAFFFFQKKPWKYGQGAKISKLIREQFHPFMISAGAMLYARLMLPVVNFINPTAAVSFNQGLQLYNYWTMSTAITGSSFQNWVNREGKKSLESSLKFTAVWFTLHGIVLGGALWLLGPFVSNIIFGRSQGNDTFSFLLLGLTFFFVALGTALVTLYLTPLGYSYISSKITIFAGLLGLVLLFFLTKFLGVNGSYIALCSAEVTINILALFVVRKHRKGKLKAAG